MLAPIYFPQYLSQQGQSVAALGERSILFWLLTKDKNHRIMEKQGDMF